jgi:hypothetical protein
MTTVKLNRPVAAHGDQIDALTFREPMGEDIEACGYPFTVGGTTENPVISPIAPVLSKYMVLLGGVPASTIKKLSAPDWNACATAVLGFFGVASQK